MEISGTYDQTVRAAINGLPEEFFQEGLISPVEARRFALLVRIADHTDASVILQNKPSHVDWVAESRTQQEIAEFADWDSLIDRIRNRVSSLDIVVRGNGASDLGRDGGVKS